MRKELPHDILSWCKQNVQDADDSGYKALEEAIDAENSAQYSIFEWVSINSYLSKTCKPQELPLVEMKHQDLAQYLAIYDYVYISRLLSQSYLEDFLIPITKDEISGFIEPDTRANQVHSSLRPTNAHRYNAG